MPSRLTRVDRAGRPGRRSSSVPHWRTIAIRSRRRALPRFDETLRAAQTKCSSSNRRHASPASHARLRPIRERVEVSARLVSGFVDAVAGGGALIAIPALLYAGVPPLHALGTNKLQSLFGNATALGNYARFGFVDWRRNGLTMLVVFVGARHVMAGTLSVGELVVFAAYLASLYVPLNEIVQTWALAQSARAGVWRVFEILDVERTVVDALALGFAVARCPQEAVEQLRDRSLAPVQRIEQRRGASAE